MTKEVKSNEKPLKQSGNVAKKQTSAATKENKEKTNLIISGCRMALFVKNQLRIIVIV